MHPAFVPSEEGLRFKVAYTRGVLTLRMPRASVFTRSQSQVGLLVYSYVGGGVAAQTGLQSQGHPLRNTWSTCHTRSQSQVRLLGHLSVIWVHVPGGRFTCVHAALASLGGGGRFKVAYNRRVV